jgi:acetyltransferase
VAIDPRGREFRGVWQASDGPVVTLRPIRPEDAEMEQEFVRGLSEQSRQFRFMNPLRELTPAMLARFTQIDYDREFAIIAVQESDGREIELGVARYVVDPDGETCEFAIVVADRWQRRGLGGHMLETLIEIARSRGLRWMIGNVLATNEPMLRLARKLGFAITGNPDDATTKRVTLRLDPS